MQLAFLNRSEELARLRAALARRTSTLTVLYGRRRCGKSRLLRHALAGMQVAYYVGDDREGILQRSALAAELARIIPGFDQVTYPEWGVLFSRWWEAAPPGAVLALDEFPALVARAREIPSLLQKHIDVGGGRRIHVVLAGSSQRMMH
ncbi:MAG: ATP-binding protein, partial [Candidatus Eisenbacteria sp.]|nr:ATP-binding protein [Candidatus Eisenbacteria bacterium]